MTDGSGEMTQEARQRIQRMIDEANATHVTPREAVDMWMEGSHQVTIEMWGMVMTYFQWIAWLRQWRARSVGRAATCVLP